MAQINIPDHLVLTDNSANGFARFAQKFDLFLLAADAGNTLNDKSRIALFLTAGGDKLLDVFNSISFQATAEMPTPSENYEHVREQIRQHFEGMTNEVYDRYIFRCRVQEEKEKFMDFLTDLRLKIKKCNFGSTEVDGILRDQIVFGVSNDKARLDMLKASKLTLDEAIRRLLEISPHYAVNH